MAAVIRIADEQALNPQNILSQADASSGEAHSIKYYKSLSKARISEVGEPYDEHISCRMKKPIVQIRDRRLGDEWKHWGGGIDPCVQNAETGKRIFLFLLLGFIVATFLIGVAVWYLVVPRLRQVSPMLPAVLLWGWLIFCGGFFAWFLLISLSLFLKKDLLLRFGKKEFSISFVLPHVFRLGQKLHIPYDRLANSFVKVSNALIGIRPRKIKPKSLLILLPRCLEKSLQHRILQFSRNKNIPVYIVPGGELARRTVLEKQPRAIIGVACERDLLSGIKDLTADIPIIGIPNLRPEGPCKNTLIDFDKLEKAVNTFLGSG
jgi:uncharacterized protein